MTGLIALIGIFFLTYGILHPIKAIKIYLSIFCICIIIFVVISLLLKYISILF
jgi:hypothetical protein